MLDPLGDEADWSLDRLLFPFPFAFNDGVLDSLVDETDRSFDRFPFRFAFDDGVIDPLVDEADRSLDRFLFAFNDVVLDASVDDEECSFDAVNEPINGVINLR